MTKRILSVVLVLVVFFGGYSVLPKKFNLMPVNDAYCATKNYGGLYYVNKGFTINKTVHYKDRWGIPVIDIIHKEYKAGTYISLTNSGYDSNKTQLDLKPYIGKNISFVRR